jgi:hypothetical protein
MRKVWSFTCTDTSGRKHTGAIYRDSENAEYVVRLYVKSAHQKRADYFTNDLTDAKGTAKAMARRSCGPAQEVAL